MISGYRMGVVSNDNVSPSFYSSIREAGRPIQVLAMISGIDIGDTTSSHSVATLTPVNKYVVVHSKDSLTEQ